MLFQVSDLDDKAGIGHDETGKAIRARHQLSIVDCEDANGNTPLSEAASTILFSKHCISHSKQMQKNDVVNVVHMLSRDVVI